MHRTSTKSFFLLVLLCLLSISRAVAYPPDSVHVWHVAKTGNDGNGGHAQQYPIDLSADAKLTIGAAVAAASNGDTIIIWPGDYDENVDLDTANKSLTLQGTHRRLSKIIPATGTGITAENDCAFYNLAVEAIQINAAGVGIKAQLKNNIIIDNCDIYGGADGVYTVAVSESHQNIWINNCRIRAKFDGANLAGGEYRGIICTNTMFITEGTYGTGEAARALVGSGYAVFKNCMFIADRDDTSSEDIGGVSWAGRKAIFTDCVFNVLGGDNVTGAAYGLKTLGNATQTRVLLSRCNISTECANAGTGPFDLYAYEGTITHNSCSFSTSDDNSGTGTLINEIASVLNTAIPGSPTAHSINERVKAIDDKLPSRAYLRGTTYDTGLLDGSDGANIEGQCEDAIETYNLDRLLKLAISPGHITDNSLFAKLVSKSGTATWSDYINTTDSLQAVRDNQVSAAAFVSALMADTGVTAGGTWTYEEWCKIVGAYLIGTWRDKSGADSLVQEILDPEDDATVIMELSASATSPYKTTTKK